MEKDAYKMSVEETFKVFGTSLDGLTESEAKSRLEKNGLNKLDEAKHKGFFGKLIEQFKNIMIIILIIAAIISFITAKIEGESYTESIVIFAVVILNAVLGVIQESKAEKAIDALKKMSLPYIKVRRGGKIESIKTEELVVGDIVLVEAGDYVPADLRIIQSNSLRTEEAALTGESLPVDKFVEKITDNAPLGDRKNILYSGSSVVYGRGEGIVVATGMKTEIGKIASILTQTKDSLTPLQKKMNEISKILSVIVVIIGLIMVLLGLAKNNPLLEMFLLAVSLAVAAIPEGLPASITIILSIGVQKMSKRNSIIRKMSSVETLGATEIICSDKTGTLTQNKMTVKGIAVGNKGYLGNHFENAVDDVGIKRIINCMVLCNDIKSSESGYLGDPTEIALGVYAENMGYSKIDLDVEHERVAELPFDSVRKMMTTINRDSKSSTEFTAYTKGALESILPICTKIELDGEAVTFTEELKQEIIKLSTKMSNDALRVLAYAYKPLKKIPEVIDSKNLESDLVFAGLSGMIDPPRPEVKKAVKSCFDAGMIPIMITGDNKETAIAIAREIGILTGKCEAITGSELDQLSDKEFEKRIKNIRVYARVSPENKVRIVQTWKKLGRTVAMTGDGVNDAPALKAADIGVGMGITGTEVSKSVSSMVLTDDNFASIVCAVEEGRRIYKNIQNVIVYLLASNIAEVIIVFIATLFNSSIFKPIHLLWINLITDAVPAMTLGFEPAEKNIMKEKPRKADEKFFTPFLITRIVVPAVIKAIIILCTYFYIENLYDHSISVTMCFIMLSLMELFFAFSARSDKRGLVAIGIAKNPQMLIGVVAIFMLQVIVTLFETTRSLLGITLLEPRLYAICIIIPIIFFFMAETCKILIAKVFNKVK